MNAISADQKVCLDLVAVRKSGDHLVAALCVSNESMPETDRGRRQSMSKNALQVGAMKGNSRRVIRDRHAVDEHAVFVEPAYLFHHAGSLENLLREVELFEDAHSVGPKSDRCADLEQGRRLFKHLTLKTGLL